MTTTLIIARHGNTFTPDQTPTRVGARTDLPLVASGEEQAKKLGLSFQQKNLSPDIVFTSNLQRTIRTAELSCPIKSTPLSFLNEIDYGEDENKPESAVVARIGEETLKHWDENGEMPKGWSPRPAEITQNWCDFMERCADEFKDKTILTVTSNGIARFALMLAENGHEFPIKLATGAYGILTFDDDWVVTDWNIRP